MRRTGTLFVLLVALAGCTSSGGGGQSYDLSEFAISGPTSLSAATRSVSVTNSGEFSHTLVVTGPGGEVVAATSLVPSGQTATLEVDLEPGVQYSFTCRIVSETADGRIVDHFEAGMHTTVSIGP